MAGKNGTIVKFEAKAWLTSFISMASYMLTDFYIWPKKNKYHKKKNKGSYYWIC